MRKLGDSGPRIAERDVRNRGRPTGDRLRRFLRWFVLLHGSPEALGRGMAIGTVVARATAASAEDSSCTMLLSMRARSAGSRIPAQGPRVRCL